MTVLGARALTFAHPDGPPVLTGVDLDVAAGSRTAVLGANGSGKTTLFRLLAGGLRPSSGQVLLDGDPLRHDRAGLNRLRRRVQLVLQEPDDQLFAPSVFQDVGFGPLNLGLEPDEVRDRVLAALAATGTTGLADRPPHLLSFGQRKRVALAGALAMAPDVLVLDEPAAGLDPAGVTALVATLDAFDGAVLLSTHDVDLAWGWATDAAVVLDGTVVTGPVGELLDDDALLAAAALTRPWAPLVNRALGVHVRTAAELARALAPVRPAVGP